MLSIVLTQMALSFINEKLETRRDDVTAAFYHIIQLTNFTALMLMVVYTIARAKDVSLLQTVFLLRSTIDTCYVTVNSLLIHYYTNPYGNEHRLRRLAIQAARYSFWVSIHIMQCIFGSHIFQASRFICLIFFIQDFTDLIHPIRLLLKLIVNERYIKQMFPRITASELHNLTSSGELNCSVCLSEHDHDTVKLPCSHHLHGACLRRIFEQCHTANITLPLHLPRRCPRCPICRADIHLHDDNRSSQSSSVSMSRGSRPGDDDHDHTPHQHHPRYNRVRFNGVPLGQLLRRILTRPPPLSMSRGGILSMPVSPVDSAIASPNSIRIVTTAIRPTGTVPLTATRPTTGTNGNGTATMVASRSIPTTAGISISSSTTSSDQFDPIVSIPSTDPPQHPIQLPLSRPIPDMDLLHSHSGVLQQHAAHLSSIDRRTLIRLYNLARSEAMDDRRVEGGGGGSIGGHIVGNLGTNDENDDDDDGNDSGDDSENDGNYYNDDNDDGDDDDDIELISLDDEVDTLRHANNSDVISMDVSIIDDNNNNSVEVIMSPSKKEPVVELSSSSSSSSSFQSSYNVIPTQYYQSTATTAEVTTTTTNNNNDNTIVTTTTTSEDDGVAAAALTELSRGSRRTMEDNHHMMKMKMMLLSNDVDVTGIDSMNIDKDKQQQYSSSSGIVISSPRQTARNNSAIAPAHDVVLSAVCCPHDDDNDQHVSELDTIGRHDCESDTVQAIEAVKIAGDKRKLPTDLLLGAIEDEEEKNKKYPKVEEF